MAQSTAHSVGQALPPLAERLTPKVVLRQKYQAIVVTGASAGIGYELAWLCAPSCAQLVLVARRQQRLDELAAQLGRVYPKLKVYVLAADLADPDDRARLLTQLQSLALQVDLLINNAGLGDSHVVVEAAPERLSQIVELNVSALTALSRWALPGMLQRRRGGILNVGSIVGVLPVPGMATYAASKAFVASFTDALRVEVAGSGVRVCALCPGPVETEFAAVAGPRVVRSPRLIYQTAQVVAAAGLRAWEQDRPRVFPGLLLALLMPLLELVPAVVLRLCMRLLRSRKSAANSKLGPGGSSS